MNWRLVAGPLWVIVGVAARADALTDRFVAEARAAYATETFADYRKSVLTEPAYRDAAKREPRADLGGETVRWIDVEGTCNFRDIGGWTGLRTGLVYRGAEPNCHTNVETLARLKDRCHNLFLTERGKMTLAQDLGIRTDLDLRCSAESPTPDETPIPGARLVRIASSKYTNFVQETAIAARLLRLFADEANYPIYFHCYGGADRTGSLAFLLEGLCGVSEADLSVDYELTSFSRIGLRPRYDECYSFASMVREMKRRPGKTLKEKIEHYVRKECGLTAGEVAKIRRILCPPSPETVRPMPYVSAARRVTDGPHEHLLANYFGINAWSSDSRYLLALETDLNGRLPEIGDSCDLGLVDLKQGGFKPFARTHCWNFQEAAMAHWLSDGTVAYNDLRNGRFVTVVRDPHSRRERLIPYPLSAVSPDGTKALSINYARLRLTRPDYGYPGDGQDARADDRWPKDDGLWLVDLRTGSARLIVSVASCRDRMPEIGTAKGLAYFCHTVFSRDGSKVFWLARTVEDYDRKKRIGDIGRKTVAFTCNADGTDVRRSFPDGWDGSHFNWKDGDTLCVTAAYGGETWTHVEYTVGEEKGVRILGGGFLNWDGHCVYSPDGRYLSTEGYRDSEGYRHWKLLRLSDGEIADLGKFFVPDRYRPVYWRCDLHARWRNDGRQLAFNSTHEGSRQIYIRDVSGL